MAYRTLSVDKALMYQSTKPVLTCRGYSIASVKSINESATTDSFPILNYSSRDKRQIFMILKMSFVAKNTWVFIL